jgi:hypothetical protein
MRGGVQVMPITNTAPPAKTKPSTSSTVKKSSSVSITEQRTEALSGLGQIAQAVLIASKQYADAGALGIHWDNISREVATLAEKQESVAKLIDPLLQAGPYAALIAVVLPLGLQLAVNHGVGNPGMMGTVPKELLDSQMKTRVAKMQMEALKQQKEAEAELKAMQEENES